MLTKTLKPFCTGGKMFTLSPTLMGLILQKP